MTTANLKAEYGVWQLACTSAIAIAFESLSSRPRQPAITLREVFRSKLVRKSFLPNQALVLPALLLAPKVRLGPTVSQMYDESAPGKAADSAFGCIVASKVGNSHGSIDAGHCDDGASAPRGLFILLHHLQRSLLTCLHAILGTLTDVILSMHDTAGSMLHYCGSIIASSVRDANQCVDAGHCDQASSSSPSAAQPPDMSACHPRNPDGRHAEHA